MGKRRPISRKQRREARAVRRAERRALKLIAKQERRQLSRREQGLGLDFWSLQYDKYIAENRRRRTACLEDVERQIAIVQDEVVEIEWIDLNIRSNENSLAKRELAGDVLSNFLDKMGI